MKRLYKLWLIDVTKCISKQECIPVGCVLPSAVAVEGVCPSACWDTPPTLGVGLETPSGVGLEIPPGCGPGDPPRPDSSTSPLGIGLETPLPPRPAARHAGIPPTMHDGIPPSPHEQND